MNIQMKAKPVFSTGAEGCPYTEHNFFLCFNNFNKQGLFYIAINNL